jgi:hypothetical protein
MEVAELATVVVEEEVLLILESELIHYTLE